MRFFAFFVLTAAAAAGCGETAATLPPDANVPDGGSDGDVPDGDVPDGGVDGGLDSGVDGGIDGGGPWCETSALCPTCPDEDELCDSENPCPAGEVCLPTGCEDLERCFVTGGGACADDEDCGNPAYACDLTINRCIRTDSGCDDSNDCVSGYACENGECADRRVPCVSLDDCPHGYACFFTALDQRFCRRISRPCDDDIDCLTRGVPCGDADGDGAFECAPSLMPNEPNPVSCDISMCGGIAPVCESSVEGTLAVCGEFGPCKAPGECPMGFDCQDLWGDGRKECVLPSGSCVDSSECAPRQVCATPRTDGPPQCNAGAAM
jgi:hypothetical protein